MSNLGSLHKGDSSIWVTHFPGRKKPALAIGNKNVLRKVASFDNEDVADEFFIMLCEWLGAKEANELKEIDEPYDNTEDDEDDYDDEEWED